MFADAATVVGARERTLQFSDATENATTINGFLSLVVRNKLPVDDNVLEIGTPEQTQPYLNLVAFLQKYECASSLRLLHLCSLKLLISRALAPQAAFVLGAVADIPDLCVSALRLSCRFDGRNRNREEAWTSQGNLCVADPGMMLLGFWNLLPPRYARAYVVAWARGEGAYEHRTHYRADPHSLSYVIRFFKELLSAPTV